ncbi:sensor histidine kinase [Maribacter polysaccharolyticus]|uniref:sensor histidine kinase n=1 Tax=Maribacter polysaccharolyticus TaxID=3020831 RepID=UPI00237FBED9|nr:ATP-binding protein [Maribacter polysaccharolyticus]MDE3740430.1 ATP-binding protein [Maribacter polysaccharolyticus]
MKESMDLLDIVVAMRNEFTKLGHEAHYFWHMMWLPDKYEKAMTSGDGTRIGFVMELPRHIHGDIPLLAKWEKSKEPTVVYAMDAREAIDYVDKMVNLGDFKNIDPQAPTHDDIRHIGGLTFIMARTSHGEIGYSLPGSVKNPPKEDVDILVKFASAFDLAHQRFLDLQKAEKQSREVQIELALEKVRSRTMGMQRSDELRDTALLLFQQVEELGINSFACGFNIWDKDKKFATAWMAGKDRLQPPFRTNSSEDVYLLFREAEKRGDALFVLEQEGKELEEHYKYLVSIPEVKALAKAGLSFPTFQIIHCAYFKKGYLMFITHEPVPDAHDIFIRFAKVFEQTYTRFLDLQKAEAQARESEIELALERVRARTMAMQHSDELQEASYLLDEQVRGLGIKTWGCAFNIYGENESTEWFGNEAGVLHTYTVPRAGIFKKYYDRGQNGETLCIQEFSGDECVAHYEYMSSLPVIGDVLKQLKKTNNGFPTYQIDHVVYFKYGYLLFITREPVPDAYDIFKRFAKVFEQTYTRFLDLQKAEAQAREAQIEMSLEKVRSRTMAMQKSSELLEAGELLWNEITKLGIECFTSGYVLMDENEDIGWNYTPNPSTGKILDQAIGIPHQQTPPMRKILAGWKKEEPLSVIELTKKQTIAHQTFVAEKGINFPFSAKELVEISPKEIVIHAFNFKQGYLLIIGGEKLANTQIEVMLRFTKVFQQTYTRFLDLEKAEAQARESQIEVAVERIRAQSMAMHHPDDLKNVNSEIYKQLQLLDINGLTGVSIWLVDKNNYVKIWDLSSPGNISNPNSYSVAYDASKYDILGEPVRILKNLKEDYFVLDYPLEKLHKAVKEWSLADKAVGNDIKDAITTGRLSQQWNPFARHNNGLFSIDLIAPPNEDTKKIVTKIASAFNQAYTRFLDLQKAEAQTRTAQINLAVERVRAKALAMHKSEDILSVVAKLKEEVLSLEIPDVIAASIFLNEGEDNVRMWDLSSLEENNNGFQIPFDITFKLKKRDPNLYIKRIWENPEDYFLEKQNTKDFKRIIAWLREHEENKFADEVEEFIGSTKLEHLHHAVKTLNNGKLVIDTLNAPSEEMETILTKMGAAFDLAYKRFEDLQKAEAQAREAQIEAALERVRAKSMAMHKSEELLEVITVVSEQLLALGFRFHHVSFAHNNIDETYRFWTAAKGMAKPMRFVVPYKDIPMFNNIIAAQKRSSSFFTDILTQKENNQWHGHLLKNDKRANVFSKEDNEYMQSKGMARSIAINPNIMLILANYASIPYTEAENKIIARFGQVFEQSYTRFLDLQKAEAQARESRIEAALERVRSRSLAMHKPKELQEVVAVVAEKLKELGVIYDAGGVILCTYFPDNKDVVHWITVDDFSTSGRYLVPYFDNPIFNDAWDSKMRGDAYFSKEFPVAAKNDFFKQAFENSDYKHMPEDYKQFVLKADKHYLSAAWSKNSAIIIPSLTEAVPSENDAEIIKRFAKVFEQAYIRFMDLQKAEERARETQIDMALERVRSRTLAMQSSEELAETSMVVFQQLVALGIAPNRLFIGIIKEKGASIEAWATNEDGSEIASQFTLQASKNKTIKKMLDGWKQQKKSLVIDMKGKELEAYFHYLNNDLKIPFTDGLKQKRRVQTLAYFSGGIIGMAAPEEQPKETIDLLERFASVFNLTYTRFKDLKVAEAQAKKAEEDLINLQLAKKSAENALSELQQTQTQLIQAEKMASLGELTAGIAHEIQNPLNFVNNFSEVSNELIDEMNEELDKGDLEEARFIATDIKQNLEKINHHGKRADAIVKGMLQHSRNNSGRREPTDVNALADEYLRLAYHGLRAKDKSFNAELKTEFDDNIGPINVIPQDMGRVILNLITNAFYAVNEKKLQNPKGYRPTVSVHTKKKGDTMEIKVIDNGNGIPKGIVDKIFQPFFTTKPTGKGTGLGLSMSYDIVKAHGGKLEVVSKENEGTGFSIHLPINH